MVTFFLALAGLAVVPKVGGDAVGPTVGKFGAVSVFALSGRSGPVWCVAAMVGRLVLDHHVFENVFYVIFGECSIGLIVWWHKGIVVRIVWLLVLLFCGVLLVKGHLIDEMFELLVNDVGDFGDIVGRVAGTFAGELIFHSVFMFGCHVSAE